jgi:hypothetical protein
MIKDTISDALNLAPLNQELLPAEKVINNDQDSDYELARDNIKTILDKGNHALDELISVASQSQHPRAYEVLSTMIKTLADTNKDLLNIAKTKKELEGDSQTQQTKTINNNLFVGSTSELQKLLKQHGQD